jgi:hypothetical protein
MYRLPRAPCSWRRVECITVAAHRFRDRGRVAAEVERVCEGEAVHWPAQLATASAMMMAGAIVK